jgi:hypothetical protein
MWTLIITVAFFNQLVLLGGDSFVVKSYTTEARCQQALKDIQASEMVTGWEWTDVDGKPIPASGTTQTVAGFQRITGFCASSAPKVVP